MRPFFVFTYIFLIIAGLGCFTCNASGSLVSVSKEAKLMGVSFTFTAVAKSKRRGETAISESINEVKRIERLISSWDSTSQTSKINRNAGIAPVVVDDELFQLIKRSNKVSKITSGFFDVSFASLGKIWNFSTTGKARIPSKTAIAESIKYIGYKKIQLDEAKHTVFLTQKGMQIGFGAIGKGYAANRAKQIMLDLGIQGGVVNAGGDLISWGTKPEGGKWTVGIADPTDKDKIVSWLNVTDMAVVTSGNYEKFLEFNGKRYCHIINPKTGWPVENLRSVTVICNDAELADALATSVFVLGPRVGMELINHLQGIECYIIDAKGKMFYSTNLMKNYWVEKE